ncbi:MAG: ECF transporter S component, partial [Candidatus Dormibacteria bacterium]
MILVLISLVGVGLFLWPFSGLGLPAATPALAIGLGAVLGLLAIEVGARRMDARQLALLAALSAVDAGLRAALVTGVGGFSPIFILVLCGGYALGPRFGFLLG